MEKAITSKLELVKIDTHTHTSGISLCSSVPPKLLARAFKAKGINTIVLSNHYTQRQLYIYPNLDTLAAQYIEEYYVAKKAGQEAGVKVLFGAEVAIIDDFGYREFLLHGITPGFLRSNADLCMLTQKQLYKRCYDSDILMYQAHPFRVEHGQTPADPEYMDGVEINRHPFFDDRMDKVVKFAIKHNLGVSCGSDLHIITHAGSDGMYVAKSVISERTLASYLSKNKMPKIFLDYKTKVQL